MKKKLAKLLSNNPTELIYLLKYFDFEDDQCAWELTVTYNFEIDYAKKYVGLILGRPFVNDSDKLNDIL